MDTVDSLSEKWIKVETRKMDGIVQIAVVDSGKGIPTEMQTQIWKPFFSTKGTKGTGLGLNISKAIMEAHGGTAELDTKAAQTRFVVSLPGLSSDSKSES